MTGNCFGNQLAAPSDWVKYVIETHQTLSRTLSKLQEKNPEPESNKNKFAR